ncbi:unnamed protein product [Arabidopsis halleri]
MLKLFGVLKIRSNQGKKIWCDLKIRKVVYDASFIFAV